MLGTVLKPCYVNRTETVLSEPCYAVLRCGIPLPTVGRGEVVRHRGVGRVRGRAVQVDPRLTPS